MAPSCSPPTRTATAPPSLAERRLFHRRADRPDRLRPLEQPARSDPRLPPARPGQSRSLAAQRRRFLHPQPRSKAASIIRSATASCSPGGCGSARSSASPATSIAPSRRLYAGGGGSVRGFGYQELGPARRQQRAARRPRPQRILDRGPLPLRQLRRGRLRRRRPGLLKRNIPISPTCASASASAAGSIPISARSASTSRRRSAGGKGEAADHRLRLDRAGLLMATAPDIVVRRSAPAHRPGPRIASAR